MRGADAGLSLSIGILAASLVIPVRAARADGAFPDAQNILLPADRPEQIVMATNFGVVFSQDGGRSWLWTCEQELNSFGWLYQVGLPPRRRIFNVAGGHLVYSDDMTCGWRIAGGALAGQEVSDAWVDRAVPDRVFAIGARCCDGGGGGDRIYSVFASHDGGTTFGPALYVAPAGDSISGIESAASDPGIVYMTLSTGVDFQAVLARSTDGGGTWQRRNLTASLGRGSARLIAVDADNPDRVYLLWSDPVAGQAVVVTDDGGARVAVRLSVTGAGAGVKSFVKTATGALLVATEVDRAAGLFRSTDGGATFSAITGAPHIRGLSERGGIVYAATDNFGDGYALGTSVDDGATWKPLMAYDQMRAIAGCVKAACQDLCATQVPRLWTADVCSADAPPASGGTPGTGGNGGAVKAGAGGSGCRIVPGEAVPSPAACAGLLLAVWGLFRRRRRAEDAALPPGPPRIQAVSLRGSDHVGGFGVERRSVGGAQAHAAIQVADDDVGDVDAVQLVD